MTEDPGQGASAPLEAGADSAASRFAWEQLRSEQNLVGGVAAGAGAAALGAGLWAVLTVVTGYQIGFMAVGVGFLVGLAVRAAGKGLDPVFGVAGGALALLGCAAGNLLAVCGLIAQQEAIPILELLSRLDFTVARELMVASFTPMDLLFYGIAVYEGYRLSLRPVEAGAD